MENFEELFRLEQECFGNSWTREMLRAELENPFSAAVFEYHGEELTAFALGRVVAGEAELFQIGTAEHCRGHGIAKKILAELHELMKAREAGVCYLEVGSRNAPAIALYKSAGYERIGLRKGYYGDDDAVVMKKIL